MHITAIKNIKVLAQNLVAQNAPKHKHFPPKTPSLLSLFRPVCPALLLRNVSLHSTAYSSQVGPQLIVIFIINYSAIIFSIKQFIVCSVKWKNVHHHFTKARQTIFNCLFVCHRKLRKPANIDISEAGTSTFSSIYFLKKQLIDIQNGCDKVSVKSNL